MGIICNHADNGEWSFLFSFRGRVNGSNKGEQGLGGFRSGENDNMVWGKEERWEGGGGANEAATSETIEEEKRKNKKKEKEMKH